MRRQSFFIQWCRHCDRPIVKQDVAVRLKRHAQRFVDEHASKAGAVNEKVGGDSTVFFSLDAGDIAGLILIYLRYRVDDMMDAVIACKLTEKFPDQCGVEVIGIVGAVLGTGHRYRRTLVPGERGRDKKSIRVTVNIEILVAQGHVLKERADRLIVILREKGMVIAAKAFSRRPVGESDATFVGCVAGRHPLLFGNAEPVKEAAHLRRRAFADTNNSDRLGFEQCHFKSARNPGFRHQRRGHPAGGSAADDQNMLFTGICVVHK